MRLNILYYRNLSLKVCLTLFGGIIFSLSLLEAYAKTVSEPKIIKQQTQNAVLTAYLDLSSIVTAQERVDWVIDQHALQEITPKLAEVYCQLNDATLLLLEKKVKAQLEQQSAQSYYKAQKRRKAHFKSNRKFKELLHQQRIQQALQHIKKYKDKCPFWLDKTDSFLGIHRDAGRFQLMAETMGGLQLQKSKKNLFLGGAAQGRLIGVYGFTPTWGLGLGLEAGGASTFPKDEQGRRSLKAQWAAGVPFIVRGWWDNLRVDVELTPVARFDDQTMSQGRYGGRIALSFGVSPLRVFGVLPHIMAWIGGEHFFDQDSTWVLRGGTRIGISL